MCLFVCTVCQCCLIFLAHKTEMAEGEEYLMDCTYVIYFFIRLFLWISYGHIMNLYCKEHNLKRDYPCWKFIKLF